MTAETSNARGEWVLVPRVLVDSFPEINPSNYDHGDACALNAWGVELVLAAKDTAPPPAAARGDVRGLVSLAKRVQYADTHAQVSKDDAGEFVCLPPWLWLEIRDAAAEALAAEGVQAGDVVACAETACAMWTTPSKSDAEDAAFMAGFRAALSQQQRQLDVGSPRTPEQIAATVAWVQSLADSDIAPQPMQQGGGEVCGCGRPGEYFDVVGRASCNKHMRCSAPPSAPVGVEDGINVPAAKALIEALAPGFKVIYRSAFRWLDQGGNVLPNHYEMFSAETLARDFGYDLVLDLGYAAILRDPSALAQQPAAVDGAMPEGWRVMPFTGSWQACDERWEVYSPDGSGGVVLASEVRSCDVAELLDALATQHQEPKS